MPNPKLYRRKSPYVVEAVQVSPSKIDAIAVWCNGYVSKAESEEGHTTLFGVDFKSFDGVESFAKVGDYIVKEKDLGFFMVSEEAFQEMYTPEGWVVETEHV